MVRTREGWGDVMSLGHTGWIQILEGLISHFKCFDWTVS